MRGARRIVAAGLLVALLALGGAGRVDAGDDLAAGNSERFIEAMTFFVRGRVEEGVRRMKPLAEAGHAPAQFVVGRLFQEGYGIAKDECEALKWFEQAAAQDHASSIGRLGEFYHYDRCGAPDYDKAEKIYKRAAALGDQRAFLELWRLYNVEEWDGYSDDLAFQAVKSVWDANDDKSNQVMLHIATLLGQSYFTGSGVGENWDAAEPYYLIAAKQGKPEAQFFLGSFYTSRWRFNESLVESLQEGMKWILLSVYQENESANIIFDGYEEVLGAEKYAELLQKARETLRELAKNEVSLIGRAAKWCGKPLSASINCLRFAYIDHDACKSPIVTEVRGIKYLDSETYDACRREAMGSWER